MCAGVAPLSLANEATNNTVDDVALNKTILNYTILNGALELLPQSWASVAIIPMQIKMVYRIGKAQGHGLDQGHIREFLATVGVGMTSQYLEQFGRKLVGGLWGGLGGETGKKGGANGHQCGVFFCDNLCALTIGQTLLRCRSPNEHCTAETNLWRTARTR